jgi:hypothetical protein
MCLRSGFYPDAVSQSLPRRGRQVLEASGPYQLLWRLFFHLRRNHYGRIEMRAIWRMAMTSVGAEDGVAEPKIRRSQPTVCGDI